jgi:hypothetical protein
VVASEVDVAAGTLGAAGGVAPSTTTVRVEVGRAKGGRCDRILSMIKVLKEAIVEVATLPESDQELIGRELLVHVEKLRSLRADIAHGVRSLDVGKGKRLDIEDVISRARGRYVERVSRQSVGRRRPSKISSPFGSM